MTGMRSLPPLAYVFWHWIRSDADTETYESRLIAFQETLLANAPSGYHGGAVYRQGPVAWLPQGQRCYVDWYRIDSSAALDALNDAAVSAACRSVHDAAAELARGGTAGLYGLRRGRAAPRDVAFATWFPKPEGMTYAGLEADLEERLPGGGFELWCRRMTLGPSPELCLLAASAVTLPDAWDAVAVPMAPIWPVAPGDTRGSGARMAAP